jgi:hypothetical protein
VQNNSYHTGPCPLKTKQKKTKQEKSKKTKEEEEKRANRKSN